MKRSLVLAACAALIGVVAPALTNGALAAPKLSGTYVYTWIERCVSTGGQTSVSNTTALVALDPETHMATFNGFTTGGSPPVLAPISGTASYANTATTVTIDDTVYKAFYGKLVKKVATYVSLIAVVPGDSGATCADQLWLSQQ